MAIDGILLSKMVPEVQAVLPLRIQKIYEISNTEVLFQVHGAGGKKQLLISCHSVYNRFLLTKRSYPTPMEPGNFVMVLRKYLEGSIIEAVAGDDIYLSIDVDLQKGIYHLLEQKLAGILINHLVNDDVNPEDSDHLIPVKQAYFQIINNNVLDLNLFQEAEAGTAQRRIFYYFTERQEKVLTAIRKELLESGARSYKALGEDMQTYFTELYDVLQ